MAVGDMADVIHPHPLTREGVVVAMWQIWGPSKGGDIVMVMSMPLLSPCGICEGTVEVVVGECVGWWW